MKIKVKKFQKRKEDFTCENCGHFVKGDGYVNHCPLCLFSKHVDIFPGDRLEDCGGLMRPVDIIGKKGLKFTLVHECTVCKEKSKSPVRDEDSSEALLDLAKDLAQKKFEELQ